MSYPTKNYSDYVKRLCSLTGVPVNGLTTDEKGFYKEYFEASMKQAWQRTNWLEICPEGEARLVGNLWNGANDFTNHTYYNTAFDTITSNVLSNPADARVTAGFVSESALNAQHYIITQFFVGAVPATNYQFSIFVRPNLRNFIILVVYEDGFASQYCAGLNLTGGGSVVSTSGCTASISQSANGFYLCSMNFTTSAVDSGLLTEVFLSSDGIVNPSGGQNGYQGVTGSGIYLWGWWLGQAQNFPANQLIPWEQTGEEPIEAVFEVWRSSKYMPGYPVKQAYNVVPDGIQVINTQSLYWGPYYGYPPYNSPLAPGTVVCSPIVFLDYRKKMPAFNGDDFSASSTYAVGDSVLFTDSSSVSNYWTCAVATSAGQSPTTTPASWTEQLIPAVFFDYAVYTSYAEWLRQDGQTDKANDADEKAEQRFSTEFDTQERQEGHLPSFKVATHVTSQPRF